jgi:hypothetical protein
MTNEQLYILLGVHGFQMIITLWMINHLDRSINKRIDDFKQELKDLLRSEIKRLEDKITTVKL